MASIRIPYGKQSISEEDIQAVVEVLRSDWITQGPKIEEFEKAVALFSETPYAVAVSNGTAGLHAALHAAGIQKGDEVIVPPMTFAATANAVLYCQATPVFSDVDPSTLLLDPEKAAAKITSKTKAIISVDYAGHPGFYNELRETAQKHNLTFISDACHAIGAEYNGRKVGSLADMTVFSFHPVKHITTGEGGMVVTANPERAQKMRVFRNHGITTTQRQRSEKGTWIYEMTELGFNYRITDIQSALGIKQLEHLPGWLERRREIARRYTKLFSSTEIRPLQVLDGALHAYHLYVVRLPLSKMKKKREQVFHEMRDAGIGVNVHYIPVHLHPFYKKQLGTKPGLCPEAENAYEEILSLPMYSSLKDSEVDEVVTTLVRSAV